MKNRIHEKGYRNNPLTEEQKQYNISSQKQERGWNIFSDT